MDQTIKWLNSIAEKGKLVNTGDGLSFKDSAVVHHKGLVTDGPFGEIKETIGGFVVVRAESIDEAVGFAKGCPVLQGEGNTVEVRKLAKHAETSDLKV